MSIKSGLTILFLTASAAAQAQRATPRSNDTVLKGSTIEVIQSYKPKVKQTPKPEWIPQLPPADTTHPAFSYDVPQQALNYTYNSQPLRPLALGRAADPLPFPNYVKLGGGNLSTIFADAGIGGLHGDNYESAIHLHHLSQKGTVKNQQSSLSGIEAEGTLHQAAGEWHASVAAARNQYNYYGYDHVFYDYPKDSVRQVYTTIRAIVDMAGKPDSSSRFSYHPTVNASLYNARYKTSEVSAGFDAPVSYRIDSFLDLSVALNGNITNYKTGSASIANNFIQVMPGVAVHKNRFTGHGLAGFGLGKGSAGYILPDVLATYTIPDDKLAFSLGYQSKLRQNTYEQLTTENPYMISTYNVLQGRRDEAFFEVRGSAGSHLSFTGRASWWNMANLPSFLNDTGDQKQMYVWYQDVKAISVQLGARYHVANTWSAGIAGDFYSFYNIKDQSNTLESYVWHQPSMRIKGDVMVHVGRKLIASAYVSVLGGIHARDINYNVVALRTISDVGLNGEYQIIKRLSAFVQISNLLNNKYERWLGYQAYGLNIYGGIRLKF